MEPNSLEVLVSEDDGLSLSNEERKFVQARIEELGDLNAVNFSPNIMTDVLQLGVLVDEIRFGGVSTKSRLDVYYDRSSELVTIL